MLKLLRNKKLQKKVWIGLAIIIIPAFAFWGFGGAMRSKSDNTTIGRISGRPVTSLELNNSISAVRTFAIMQFGEKLPEIEKFLNFPEQAWERLVLLHEAKRLKININDKEVIEAIQKSPAFRDKSGFNNKVYEETLRYAFGIKPRTFEEQLRESLTLSKLYARVTDKIKLSDEQIRQEYMDMNEELSVNYIGALFSNFAAKAKPSDNQIADFYEKNKSLFQEPATKDKSASIPELAKIKDKVKDALIKDISRKAAETAIKECAEKLKQMDLTRAASACALKSGSTGFFKSSGQIKDLGDARIFWNAAKKLEKEKTSPPLLNNNGYYIISLKSVKLPDEKQFEKDKIEFSQKLISSKKSRFFATFTQDLLKKSQKFK